MFGILFDTIVSDLITLDDGIDANAQYSSPEFFARSMSSGVNNEWKHRSIV